MDQIGLNGFWVSSGCIAFVPHLVDTDMSRHWSGCARSAPRGSSLTEHQHFWLAWMCCAEPLGLHKMIHLRSVALSTWLWQVEQIPLPPSSASMCALTFMEPLVPSFPESNDLCLHYFISKTMQQRRKNKFRKAHGHPECRRGRINTIHDP